MLINEGARDTRKTGEVRDSREAIRNRCAAQKALVLGALQTNSTIKKPLIFANALKETSTPETLEVRRAISEVCTACSVYRKVTDAEKAHERQSLEQLRRGNADLISKMARLSDSLPLEQYSSRLRYVPRLVNVVTLATLKPVDGSGSTLPLPLDRIAKRCTGAFFAPKRFSAVQLAFRSPRCRMLIFETGRLVGTGGKSIVEARLATLMACVQMSKEAGVHMQVESFEVVNLVGAVALKTTIDCEEFQKAHSSTTMLDRSSFVGMVRRIRSWCSRVHTIPFNLPDPLSPFSRGRRLGVREASRSASRFTAQGAPTSPRRGITPTCSNRLHA